ncbi:MAG: hypothetical protein ABJL54_02605 [Halioglobus sp.]
MLLNPPMHTRRAIVELLALLIILIACAQYGFYELFSNYREYDDEGLFMLSNKLYLDGHIPYNEITWIFGPLQLAVVKVLHGWSEVPISNSAVRFLTLAHWLLLSLIAYSIVRRSTKSWLWSASALILVFLYPRSLVNEPGHPQVLVAILVLFIPLIAGWYESRGGRLTWVAVGALVAAVFHIKINAGVFCVVAALVVLVRQSYITANRRYIYPALLVVSSLLPFLLMYPLLSVENCLRFAFIVSFSAASFAVVVPLRNNANQWLVHNAIAFCGGFFLVSAVALGFAAAEGASPLDILSSLLDLSASQIEFFHFFREYSRMQVCMAGLSLAMALIVARSQNPVIVNRTLWSGRGFLIVSVIYALVVDDPANSQALIGYAAPWCWVAAVKPSDEDVKLDRLLLVALAVWMPLLAYPIPGTQLYFGGFLILIVAIFCAIDVNVLLTAKYPKNSHLLGRNVLPLSLFLIIAYLLHSSYYSARKQYAEYKPLELTGTGFMRVEPNRARHYHSLVRSLAGADVVLTTSRFNSLYFWTGASFPSPGFLSQFPLANSSTEHQKAGETSVLNASRPMLVIKKSPLIPSRPGFSSWIDLNFEISKEIGPYTVMRRRSDP